MAAPPIEVTSQSETFAKPVAKQKQSPSLDDYPDGPKRPPWDHSFLLTGRLYWLLCGAYFDEFYGGRRSRNRKAVFAKTFDVELNGFLDEFENFVTGVRNCHTTRQVGNMRTKTGFALFNDDSVFHISDSISNQPV